MLHGLQIPRVELVLLCTKLMILPQTWTFLPYHAVTGTVAGPSQFLKDVNMNGTFPFSAFTLLIIATAIGNRALRHIKLSTRDSRKSSGLEYDFWTHHFKLDSSVANCLMYSPFTPGVEGGLSTEDPLTATTHLTLLAITIALHRTALQHGGISRMPANSGVMAESTVKATEAAKEIAASLASNGAFAEINVSPVPGPVSLTSCC